MTIQIEIELPQGYIYLPSDMKRLLIELARQDILNAPLKPGEQSLPRPFFKAKLVAQPISMETNNATLQLHPVTVSFLGNAEK